MRAAVPCRRHRSKEIEMRSRHFVTSPSIPFLFSLPPPPPLLPRPSFCPFKSAISLERNFPDIRSTRFRFRFLFCASPAAASPPTLCLSSRTNARAFNEDGKRSSAGGHPPLLSSPFKYTYICRGREREEICVPTILLKFISAARRTRALAGSAEMNK